MARLPGDVDIAHVADVQCARFEAEAVAAEGCLTPLPDHAIALQQINGPAEILIVRSTRADGSTVKNSAALSLSQQSILASLIETSYYTAQAGMNFGSLQDLVDHYLQVGWREGIDPTATFQSARYANTTPGPDEGGGNPFVHYLFNVVGEDALTHAFTGLSEADIIQLRAHFEADWYARDNPDIDMSSNDPFIHYMTLGWREGRDPSPSFATSAYLDLYSDIRDCGINPFRHWIIYGIGEGRLGGKASSVACTLESWESLSIGQQLILVRMFELDYFRSCAADPDDDGMSLAQRAVLNLGNAGAPTPTFRAAKYVAAHPELRETRQVPLLHYLFATVGEDALRDLFVAQPPAIVQAICAHFDTAWYLYSYPDVEASGQDAFIHYMTVGWREHRDPSQEFSTKAYLLRYPDIVDADVNPFWHWIMYGQAEGRSGSSSASNFRNRAYAPSVTAILINSEVDPLTSDSIAAVVGQSYADFGILIVGAELSDACRTVLDNEAPGWRKAHSICQPGDGSLPPWVLLRRAAEQATSDLLWVVQGGWVHDHEFLARLTSSFADGSVQLGFGQCLRPEDADYAIDQNELARRMERWTRHATTPAALWFADRLRFDQLVVDQHSFLWRRRKLSHDVWRGADDYRHLGFWHLFLHIASGGQVATVRDAVMRSPRTLAASCAAFDTEGYRGDRDLLGIEVQSFWSLPEIAPADLPRVDRTKRHVLIVTHGIFAGGAENLPIQMANALAERDIIVSLLIFKVEVNPEMRATLNPGVSIYEADWVMEYGCEQFIRNTGCSLIHSHGVIGEMFFFRLCENPLPVPYIATLHGSYEASSSTELPEPFIAKTVRNVDLFIYTADKNLGPLLRHDVRPGQLIKMSNAMPVDTAAFPLTRAELGIAEDAVVFTLVARGIPEKGWSTALNAFKAVQKRNPRRPMHLCLVGEGDEPDRLKPLHAKDASISFLGFQLRIHGLYRITDAAIVPTRFAGESFPLCIIQALQVATPVIATDVGEIASMLNVDGVAGGIVVKSSRIDTQFDAHFTDAMHAMVDDKRRRQLSQGAGVLGEAYDMAAFTDRYIGVYDDVIQRFDEPRPAAARDGSSGAAADAT